MCVWMYRCVYVCICMYIWMLLYGLSMGTGTSKEPHGCAHADGVSCTTILYICMYVCMSVYTNEHENRHTYMHADMQNCSARYSVCLATPRHAAHSCMHTRARTRVLAVRFFWAQARSRVQGSGSTEDDAPATATRYQVR